MYIDMIYMYIHIIYIYILYVQTYSQIVYLFMWRKPPLYFEDVYVSETHGQIFQNPLAPWVVNQSASCPGDFADPTGDCLKKTGT